MWHEARKQEKKIRGMIVDYRKRAERRREFYEKTKADPTQFLQLHGRKSKIYVDPTIASAADSPANMMPWLGQKDNLIDRFDVRAHLDHIPEVPTKVETKVVSMEDSWEERQANYERYRILVQNDFLGVTEERFLHQIHLEEQFGSVITQQRSKEEEKKKLAEKKAAIAYTYEDSTPQPARSSTFVEKVEPEEEEEEDVDDIDFDLNVDVSQIGTQQAHEINQCGTSYGLVGNDFYSLLTKDLEEQEALRLAREHEEEKAMYSGRKSRRERRAFREKRLMGRKISPPSYAARESPTYDTYRESMSKSRSRSHSPVNSGQITYITSFGGDSEEEEPPVQGPMLGPNNGASKPHQDTSKSAKVLPKNSTRAHSTSATQQKSARRRSSDSPESRSRRSRDRNRSRTSHSRRSRSHSRRRSRSRSHSRKRSRSRSASKRSRSRSLSRKRSRSRSHSRKRSRSRSLSRKRSRSRSLSRKRSRSRSLSRKRSRSRSRSRKRSRSRSRSHSRHRNIRRKRRSSSSRSSSRSSSTGSSARSRRSRRNSSSSSYSSRSRSPSRQTHHKSVSPKPLPAPPIKRYYGRKKEDSDSSASLSDMEVDDQLAPVPTPLKSDAHRRHSSKSSPSSVLGKSGAATKSKKSTPRELLKKKMQVLLNRQYKADKRAEKEKRKKAEQERHDREEELREISQKLRRKLIERERLMLEDVSDDEADDLLSNFDSNSGSPKATTASRRSRSSSSSSTRRRNTSRSPRRNKSPSPHHRSSKQTDRSYGSSSSRDRDSRYDKHREQDRSRNRRSRDRTRSRSRSPHRRRRPLVDY